MLRNKSEINGRIILDDANIIKKFAKTHDKLFMTMNEAMILSREIAYRISALSQKPEILIAIGHGANLMSRVISSELNIPVETILIQRKASIFKENISRIPGLRALISRWYHIPGLNIPIKYFTRWLSSLARVSPQSPPIVHGKHVILVDDVIETGKTLRAARDILSATGARSINTAVLIWSDNRNLNQEESIRPDIFIGQEGQHFPWSMNSPYFHEYESWLKQPHV